ncbi:DUF2694 family protein [Paracidovorax sp. MALMAid1276]|uniref:DUF2694 family protein n=1 Tax=Paracidovorax sp. MALMAid1276 TaxID=3411631 RepID=UPI003B9BC100
MGARSGCSGSLRTASAVGASSRTSGLGATSHSGRSLRRKCRGGTIHSRSPSNATFTCGGRQLAGVTVSSEHALLSTALFLASCPVAACHTVRATAQRPCGLSMTTASCPPPATAPACGRPTLSSCRGLLPTNRVVTWCSSSCSTCAPCCVFIITRQRRPEAGRSRLHTADATATQRERPKRREAISRSASSLGYRPTLALTMNMRRFTNPTCTGRMSPSRKACSRSSTAVSVSSARPCSRLK